MKMLLLIVLGVILVPLLLLAGIQRMAAERVEVVELLTHDEAGEPVVTRLWVVDLEGHQYLRVAADGSGWYSRTQQNGSIEVIRDGVKGEYTIKTEPEKWQRINQLMQEKYTWGDSFIGALFGRENSIPIRLVPVEG